MNEEFPPAVPPTLALEPQAAPPKGPWGFWATLGLSALIGVAFVGVQAIVVAVYVAAKMIVTRSQSPPSVEEIESNGFVMAVMTILCAPVVAGLSILFVRLRNGPSIRDYLGWHLPTLKQFVRWTVALLVLVVASDWLTQALGRPLIPDVMVEMYRSSYFPPLLWFALIVAAPLSEEFLFRGFLFRGIQNSRPGPVAAILISSTAWAGIHLQYDFYGIATIFASGILLGLARLKTGSVLLCMMLHALMNLLATLEIIICFPE